MSAPRAPELSTCLWALAVVLASCGERPFDAEAWREGNWRDRYHQVPTLVESGMLEGLSRDSVVALLGPPDAAGRSPSPDILYMEYHPAEPAGPYVAYYVDDGSGEDFAGPIGTLFIDLGGKGHTAVKTYLAYAIGE